MAYTLCSGSVYHLELSETPAGKAEGGGNTSLSRTICGQGVLVAIFCYVFNCYCYLYNMYDSDYDVNLTLYSATAFEARDSNNINNGAGRLPITPFVILLRRSCRPKIHNTSVKFSNQRDVGDCIEC